MIDRVADSELGSGSATLARTWPRRLLTRRNENEGGCKFSGLDLKVGGEGMNAFYDKIMPNVANDVLKKLGGGRVDEGAIPAPHSDDADEGGLGRSHRGAEVESGTQLNLDGQQGFDITPAMAATARSGQPLFSLRDKTVNYISDHLTSTRSFNWWDRNLGTQLHKSLKNAVYKKVYDGVQNFLNDSSRYAVEAANLAPDILPQLNGPMDVIKNLGLNKADSDAVSHAVFQGTMNDVVYNTAEEAGVNDKQFGLYQQARAAIERSLSDTFATEAVKMGRGLVSEDVLNAAQSTGDAWKVIDALANTPNKTDVQEQVYNDLRKGADKIEELKRNGYAPLMRWGQYAVEGKSADGERTFTMHETQAGANTFARALIADGGSVTSNKPMSQEAWKLFKGVTPDTLAIFAEALDVSENQAMQQYIKLATNNRSVLKRLLKRGKIAGFDEDIARTLAQFITSNARAASRNLHWGQILKDQNAIDPQVDGGDVKDEAVKLVKYMEDQTDNSGAIRGLLFVQFIGGSIASGLVNATQPMLMTFPYLAKWGTAKAAAAIAKAGKIAMGGEVSDPNLKAAMLRAKEEGITDPHEIAGLYAEAIRNLGSKIQVRQFLKLWGSVFAVTEQFNRNITFVAAYNMAPEGTDAYEFAKQAVAETQGVYNKGNRPNIARSAVGATLMTFKQYSIAYVELLMRLPLNQKMLALAMLALAAGAGGFPFEDDALDVIDTIAESLGYAFNSKKELNDWAMNTMGETLGGFALHGISGLPGVPLDVSQRLGVSNLIPGTALLKRSEIDKSRDLLEWFGAAGSQVNAVLKGAAALQEGKALEAARLATPLAIQNAMKAYDMSTTGFYRDQKGRRVIDVSAYDAMIKAVGFQPTKVARESFKVQDLQQTINLQKDVESNLVSKIARAIFEHDPEALQKARAEQIEWNLRNPNSRVFITPTQIQSQVRQMYLTRQQRFIKAAPRELKGEVAKELRP